MCVQQSDFYYVKLVEGIFIVPITTSSHYQTLYFLLHEVGVHEERVIYHPSSQSSYFLNSRFNAIVFLP